MGYSFSLLSSTLSLTQLGGNWFLSAVIIIRNDGVAPFYYDLYLKLFLENIAYTLTTNASLTWLLPAAIANLTYSNIPFTPPISSIYIKFTSNDTDIPINFALNEISTGGVLYIDNQQH